MSPNSSVRNLDKKVFFCYQNPYGNSVNLINATYTSDLYEYLSIFCTSTHFTSEYKAYLRARDFTLFYKNKPLSRRNVLLDEYNISDYSEIVVKEYCLYGGSSIVFSTFAITRSKFFINLFLKYLFLLFSFSMINDIENDTYFPTNWDYPIKYEKPNRLTCKPRSKFLNPKKKKLFRLKNEFKYFDQSFVSTYLSGCDKDWLMDLIESLVLLLQDLYVAHNSNQPKLNVSMSITRFIKSRFKSSLITKLMEVEFTTLIEKLDFIQDQSFQTKIDNFKDLLANFEEVKESKLISNVKQVINFAVAFSFFEKLGIPLKYTGYSLFEADLAKKKVLKMSKPDFVHSMLTNLIYLTEKGYQFYITGNRSAIFHSNKAYSELYDKVCLLRIQSKLLTNPEAHGFTESKYRADLDDTIEKLQSVIKFNDTLGKFEKNKLRENYNEMRMMRFELTTIKASRDHRDAPFSILLFGDSGIGKTTLKDILFYHYAAIFRLENDKTYCYTRNPVAKYWDGFVTSCWCIILDDIAFKHPNLGEDESCMEFLQINNSVPFVPDQAALDKKGTTPLKAKLVIGTTNSKNLNAHFYFSCASAAQRRFPWIITPTVKSQYQDENGMLKSELCTQIEGEYPDYWSFKIEKVKSLKATPTNLGRPANFEIVANFNNIDDFLAWYAETALKFAENQKTVKESVDMISKIVVCDKCYRSIKACTCIPAQSGMVYFASTFILDRFFKSMFNFIFVHFYYYCIFLSCGRFEGIISYFSSKISISLFNDCVRNVYARAGNTMQNSLGKHKKLVKLGIIFTAAIVSYKTIGWIWHKFFKVEKLPTQGNVNVGKVPIPHEFERENVWYNEETELSEFNLTPHITSSKSLSKDEIISKVSKNCHFMVVKNSRLHYKRYFRILNLTGNKFLMNNHSHREFVHDDEVALVSAKGYGISSNISFRLSETCTVRDAENDLCVITINQVNPGPNIMGLIPHSDTLSRQNGLYIKRNEDGSSDHFEVKNTETVTYQGDDFRCPGYKTYTQNPTQAGDCGMPLIITTPMGYAIAGIHVGGKDNITMATRICQSNINRLLRNDIIIQEGSPAISAPSQSMTLGPLHYKSVFNYLETGVAKTYGSFVGFRRKPKSVVEDTPIHNNLKAHNYEKKYTKPLMSGYIPFRTAALDMVNPVTNFSVDILQYCTNSFLCDILTGLDPIEIKASVHPYDIFTAVNGCPNVSYVDRLKVKTSAGNPWKCKKTKFVVPIEGTHDYNLTSEMMDRIQLILETYRKGIRYHPVFCAHLKDEAVTFKKASIGKTRVFTGAPMDWSIVNRMFFLPIIRLIQNNKFIFETGVGTVAQSKEWTNLLNYLMREDSQVATEYEKHFLINRFIAGDYKAFDKRMSPLFILKAFEIIIHICKISGNYTGEDEKVMWGLAYDTAFPTVDFNGDLIQFYGSNPSGHPLTVIINSLVNSLYVRYAYVNLNPNKELESFKHNVRLITYGDDNVMTSKVNWFNHTDISETLGKMGIIYTMADKEAVSRPFIHLSEVSFLKRQWIWNEEMKVYLAPLEHDSIEKMLMTWTRSKISEENQMMDIIKSACSEYFFYGKHTYLNKVKLFRTIVSEKDWDYLIVPSTFPSWGEMKKRFRNSTIRIGLEMEEYDCLDDEEDYVILPSQSYREIFSDVCSCQHVDCRDTPHMQYYFPYYMFTWEYDTWLFVNNAFVVLYMYWQCINLIIGIDIYSGIMMFIIILRVIMQNIFDLSVDYFVILIILYKFGRRFMST